MTPTGISRRDFLLLRRRPDSVSPPRLAASPPPADAAERTMRIPLQPLAPLPAQPSADRAPSAFVLRPPGAVPEGPFEATCERCGLCAQACPEQAITTLAEGARAGTPHIDPASRPCLLCQGLPCTHACPSGALMPLAAPGQVRMGTAVIDASVCTAWRGLPCRICYDVCPIPGVVKLARSERAFVPVAGDATCVGCGLCQHHCPAQGAIRIVPRSQCEDGQVQVVMRQNAKDPDAA